MRSKIEFFFFKYDLKVNIKDDLKEMEIKDDIEDMKKELIKEIKVLLILNYPLQKEDNENLRINHQQNMYFLQTQPLRKCPLWTNFVRIFEF